MRSFSKLLKFEGTVWLFPGKGGWHFVTLSERLSGEIRRLVRGDSAAWGSVRVEVNIASYRWATSIFPDSKRQAYLLPIKRDVRKALGISEGKLLIGKLLISND